MPKFIIADCIMIVNIKMNLIDLNKMFFDIFINKLFKIKLNIVKTRLNLVYDLVNSCLFCKKKYYCPRKFGQIWRCVLEITEGCFQIENNESSPCLFCAGVLL